MDNEIENSKNRARQNYGSDLQRTLNKFQYYAISYDTHFKLKIGRFCIFAFFLTTVSYINKCAHFNVKFHPDINASGNLCLCQETGK